MPIQDCTYQATASAAPDRQQGDGVGNRTERPLLLRRAHGLFRDRLACQLLPGYHLDAETAGLTQKIMHDRAINDLEPSRPLRFSDDDLRHVVGTRKCDDIVRAVRTRRPGYCRDSPPRRSASRRVSATRSRSSSLNRKARRVSIFSAIHGACSLSATRSRNAPSSTERGSSLTQTRTRSQAAQGPGMARACISVSNCSSTPLGSPSQGKLAQSRQIGRREEMLERPLGLFGNVDLAVLQPLNEIVGREDLDRSSTASARSRLKSGTVSLTRTRVIWATTSFRLSMCWMLTVVVDVRCRGSTAPRRRDSAWDDGSPERWCGPARRRARSAAVEQ